MNEYKSVDEKRTAVKAEIDAIAEARRSAAHEVFDRQRPTQVDATVVYPDHARREAAKLLDSLVSLIR